MKNAIAEIERRKHIQQEYNEKHHITPQPIVKDIRTWGFADAKEIAAAEFGPIQDVKLLEKEMKEAAKNLDFERAAQIRDLINKLKHATLSSYANYEVSEKGSPTEYKKKSPKSQKKSGL